MVKAKQTRAISLKRILRPAIDALMGILLMFLMSYPITGGLYRHGICGIALLILFLCHHCLNTRWYKAFPRGNWKVRRILKNASDLMLALVTLITIASCFFLAGEVFSFAPFPMKWWARELHATISLWLFLCSFLHLGIHWRSLWNFGAYLFGAFWPYAACALAMPGIFYFLNQGLWHKMWVFKGGIKIPESDFHFILIYMSMAMTLYLLPNLPGSLVNMKRR